MVTKKTGFAAPYRSLTFRNFLDEVISRNGVMSMSGEVSEASGIVTIPPFTFNQQGLIVTVTTAKTVNKPGGLTGSYLLVISSPTTNNVDDLVISFVESPLEVDDNEAIVAEFDGNEWRQLPFISIDELLKGMEQDRLDYGWQGPVDGLITSLDGLSYRNTKGHIIDRQGLKVRMDDDALFGVIPDDPEATWERVDRLVYRRPRDHQDRVGERKLLLGGTFSSGAQLIAGPQIFDNTDFNSRVKTGLYGNDAVILVAKGFGASFTLWLGRLQPDRTAFSQTMTQIAGVTATTDEIDLHVDPATGNCHIVYVNNGAIVAIKTDANGNLLSGPAVIDTQAQPCSHPKIVKDRAGKFLVTYLALMGPSNNQVFFASFDDGLATITGAKQITSTATNLINQDMYVTSDYQVYVAYEDNTQGKIFYDVLDDIGNVLTVAPVYVSGNVVSTGFGTNSDNASSPRIRVSDSKDLFVFFLQTIAGSKKLAIARDGAAAYSPNVVSPIEDIVTYDVVVSDWMNDVAIYASDATQTYRVIVEGEKAITQASVLAASIEATGTSARSVSALLDRTGSLALVQADREPGTFTATGLPVPVQHIGPAVLSGTQGTVVLGSNQVAVLTADLSQPLKTGQQLTLSGCVDALNNGAKIVSFVEAKDYNGLGDYTVVSLETSFSSLESPAVAVQAQAANPDGQQVVSMKTTAELVSRALRKDTLSSDILLTRVLRPGPTILNYTKNPVFSGAGAAPSLRLGVYGSSQVDWEATAPGTFTIASNFGIVDLADNVDYQVQAGGYIMNEGDAMYVALDGVTLNVTPEVRPISTLPWSDPIQILGFIKNGTFNPLLLGLNGGDEMVSGEIIVLGEDLPEPLRTRLGLTSDTSYEAYTSTIGVGVSNTYPQAIANLDLMAGQNKNIKLVKGGVWSAASGINLAWSQDAYLQVTGLPELRNRIPAGSVSLPADGYAAYVNVNRLAGPSADLVVTVAPISAIVPTRDTIVIARRVGDDVLIGDGSARLALGESQQLDSGLSNQSLSALGLVSEVDEGQLRIMAVAGTTRIRITPTDKLVFDGTTWGNEVSGIPMRFDGCQVDLETGQYFSYDGLTPLGSAFTPTAFSAPNFYRWLSINLVPSAQNVDGTMAVRPLVFEGTAGSSPAVAVKPAFTGKKLGRVLTQAQASGSAIYNLAQTAVVQLGAGSGGGGDGGSGFAVDVIDLVTSALPSGPSATLDGVTLINGMTVLFTQPPIAGVYTVSGVGSGVLFSPVPVNLGSNVPPLGFTISVRGGTSYLQTTWVKSNDGWRITDDSRITSEPTGWYDRSQCDISFDAGTRTVSLTPSTYFDFAQAGVVTRKAAVDSLEIDDVEGMHYVYYDGGELNETTAYTPDLIGRYVFVVTIYWDADNQQGVIVGDERHGLVMDSATHRYLHNTQGMRLEAGFTLSDYVLDGDGSADADAEIAISDGIVWDEDIRHVIENGVADGYFTQPLFPTARIPMLYQLDSQNWRKRPAADHPLNKEVSTAAEVVEVDTLAVTPDGAFNFDSTSTIYAQKIVATKSGILKDIAFVLSKVGLPTGIINYIIAPATGNPAYPASTQLTSSGGFNTTGLSSTPSEISASIPDDCYIYEGQEYYILITCSGGSLDGSNYFRVHRATSGGTPANTISTRVGGVWSELPAGNESTYLVVYDPQSLPAQQYNYTGYVGVEPFFTSVSNQFAQRFYFGGGTLSGIESVLSTNPSATFVAQMDLYQDGVSAPGSLISTCDAPVTYAPSSGGTASFTFNGGSLPLAAGYYWAVLKPIAGSTLGPAAQAGNFARILLAEAYGSSSQPYVSTDGGGTWNPYPNYCMTHRVLLTPEASSGGSVMYNELDGVWQLSEVPDNWYVATWVFASNNFTEPVVGITGQRVDESLDAAKTNNTYESLIFGAVPSLEMKCLYRLIYKINSAYANASKAVLVDVKDYRKAADATLGSHIPSSHGQLGGLQSKDHGAGSIFTGSTNSTPPTYDGALGPEDDTVGAALDTVDKTLGLLRLKPHPTISTRVRVTGAESILSSGQKISLMIKRLLLFFDGAEIDFATGGVYAADGSTPLGIDFTPQAVGDGDHLYYSVSLVPGLLYGDNRILGQLIVLPAAYASSNPDSAPKPPFPSTGKPIGCVRVLGTSTGIDAIAEANLTAFVAGVSGEGNGDARDFIQDVKDRLREGFLRRVTPIVFADDETEMSDPSTTAEFDYALGLYKIAPGEHLTTKQMYGPRYLTSGQETKQVEIWEDFAQSSHEHTTEVSQDGGATYQTVSMEQVEGTGRYRGVALVAGTPVSLHEYPVSESNATSVLNSTTSRYKAVSISVPPGQQKITGGTIYVSKSGTPIGDLFVAICRDDGLGSPDLNTTIAESFVANIATLPTGNSALNFSMNAVIPGGEYWLVIRPSDAYRLSYTDSGGTSSLAVRVDSTPTYAGYTYKWDGTAWSEDTDGGATFVLNGWTYDLRVRITCTSGGDIQLVNLATFYNEDQPLVVSGERAVQRFDFSGSLDQTEFVLTRFLPDADTLKVYDLNTGQVYRWPMFDVQGYTITFSPGTFLSPSETIRLVFDQSEGGGFDNSDQNASLLAANGLGSEDPTIARWSPGVGIKLMAADGSKWHIKVLPSGALVTEQIP